jgi:predicted  nucleic acid-binding Zn-ribbon protein
VFADATDKQRKELIEGLLGMHSFNSALKKCRDDLSTKKLKHQATIQQLQVVKERINGLGNELKAFQEGVQPAINLEALALNKEKVNRLLEEEQVAKNAIAEESSDLSSIDKEIESNIGKRVGR